MGTYADDPSQLYDEVCNYALGYLIFAFIVGLCYTIQISCYRYIGERITTDLRVATFSYVFVLSLSHLGKKMPC